jgi:hypothetical protein
MNVKELPKRDRIAVASAVTIAEKTEAKSAGHYLIGPNLEADERVGSERPS